MKYELSEQDENDFYFSNGVSFKDWLDKNRPVWAESARVNRKTALTRAIQNMDDDLVQQFVEAAKVTK